MLIDRLFTSLAEVAVNSMNTNSEARIALHIDDIVLAHNGKKLEYRHMPEAIAVTPDEVSITPKEAKEIIKRSITEIKNLETRIQARNKWLARQRGKGPSVDA